MRTAIPILRILLVWFLQAAVLLSACGAPAAMQVVPPTDLPPTAAVQPSPTPAPPTATSTLSPTATPTSAPPTPTETAPPTLAATATIAATAHPDSILQVKSALSPTGIAFTPTGNELVVFKDPNFEVRLVADGSLLASIQISTRVTAFDISPDGSLLGIASAGQDFKSTDLQLYAIASGELAYTVETAHDAIVQSIKFSPDGAKLLSASDDQTVKIWNVADGSLAGTIKAHTAQITCMAISPDGSQIVTGSLGGDGDIKVWTSDGQLVTTIDKNNPHCYNALFSQDNQWLLTYSGEGMGLYQVSGWERKWRADYRPANTPFVGFAPGSELFLASRNGEIELQDAAAQTATWNYSMGPTAAFDFSPDATFLAVARSNGLIELLRTGLAAVPTPALPDPVTITAP